MRRDDAIRLKKTDRHTGMVTETKISGVLCVETDAISTEENGFRKAGEIVVRIPENVPFHAVCGDEICREGSRHWYVITEIRDNRRNKSSLSHRKVIGKR